MMIASNVDTAKVSNGLVGYRRNLQDKESDNTSGSGSSSVSGDPVAWMVTALLGVGSFVLQARVSKAADENQREIEMHQAQHGDIVFSWFCGLHNMLLNLL
jgi:hypothetical protein